jgi:hypothetical protein
MKNMTRKTVEIFCIDHSVIPTSLSLGYIVHIALLM